MNARGTLGDWHAEAIEFAIANLSIDEITDRWSLTRDAAYTRIQRALNRAGLPTLRTLRGLTRRQRAKLAKEADRLRRLGTSPDPTDDGRWVDLEEEATWV